jgi:hypothetical protein
MGKKTDQILLRILRTREVYPDAINETIEKIKEAVAKQYDGLNLTGYDLSLLTRYLDSMRDTTEVLEEEVEKAVGAMGDGPDGENQALIDSLEWTRQELASAKLGLEILAELNVQLLKLCERREKLTLLSEQKLWRWREEFAPAVHVSKTIPEQWELVVGAYVLDTFKTEEEANNALKFLVSGMTLD